MKVLGASWSVYLLCPDDLGNLIQGADFKCANDYFTAQVSKTTIPQYLRFVFAGYQYHVWTCVVELEILRCKWTCQKVE